MPEQFESLKREIEAALTGRMRSKYRDRAAARLKQMEAEAEDEAPQPPTSILTIRSPKR